MTLNPSMFGDDGNEMKKGGKFDKIYFCSVYGLHHAMLQDIK